MEIILERNLLADIPYKYVKTIVLKILKTNKQTKKLEEDVEKAKKKPSMRIMGILIENLKRKSGAKSITTKIKN